MPDEQMDMLTSSGAQGRTIWILNVILLECDSYVDFSPADTVIL